MVPGRSPKDTASPRGCLSTAPAAPLDVSRGSWHACPMRHARPRRTVRSVLADALDLVHPQECAGCGQPAAGLCASCAAILSRRGFAHRPTPAPPGLPPVFTAATYDGVVRHVVLSWKERGHRRAAVHLGAMLASSVVTGVRALGVEGPLVLVPIPASREAVRARGEDVLARMVRASVAQLRRSGIDARLRFMLALERVPRDQSGLDAGARRDNLHRAIRARGRPGAGEIVLVDDIVTTGATLAEAARALVETGCRPRFAATAAATPRRRPPREPHLRGEVPVVEGDLPALLTAGREEHYRDRRGR